MQIRFTPMRHDQSLSLAKSGDTLIINDIALLVTWHFKMKIPITQTITQQLRR